jgi:tRNA(fMet)-specific endonuclease VapC
MRKSKVSPQCSPAPFKSQRTARNVALIDALQFEVMDLDQEDAKQAGEVRALLAARGAPIGPYDVLIAGQARARKLILVTRNTAEFARVPDLRIEDWESERGKKR